MLERPGLDLVGAYAFSADKVGRDVGDLIGLGRTVGVQATDDIQALIDLKPDSCSGCRWIWIRAHDPSAAVGINIVTTAGFATGRAVGAVARTELYDAALAGGASLLAPGSIRVTPTTLLPWRSVCPLGEATCGCSRGSI